MVRPESFRNALEYEPPKTGSVTCDTPLVHSSVCMNELHHTRSCFPEAPATARARAKCFP
eukprot:1157640-Pelagomonas_calceolata.AAC.9